MSLQEKFGKLEAHLKRLVVGQERLLNRMLVALLSDGHLLVEGAPGLAKTRAIKVLSHSIEGDFHRLQFTPDLLPADLTGTEIYRPQDGTFVFREGPLFHNLVLADEVNRAPAKVQSALLEAMGERQITVGSVTYPLPPLFMVMATQNPIEQEGTYPLPEAQLDRFMFNVNIEYPDLEDERRILAETTTDADRRAAPVASGAELEAARMLVRALPAASNVVDYALRLTRATRPAESGAPQAVRDWVRWGAGPRAGQALLLGAKSAALIDGRTVPEPEDVTRVALPVLRHRVLVNFQAEADGITPDDVIGKLLGAVRP